jgi:hypothetical protein
MIWHLVPCSTMSGADSVAKLRGDTVATNLFLRALRQPDLSHKYLILLVTVAGVEPAIQIILSRKGPDLRASPQHPSGLLPNRRDDANLNEVVAHVCGSMHLRSCYLYAT